MPLSARAAAVVTLILAASATASPPPGDGAPPKHTNALAGETSPYLLQHAHNPVDWMPWGPEAFARARAEDKPIFLSVGYSTCYWCHVMERESFENETIARLMNELFVCIKVDREERPDVDDVYMAAVQSLAGRGGWPMSVFLEPEGLRPYMGGTYYPPTAGRGRPGFPDVLRSASDAWRDRRDETRVKAEGIASRVAASLSLTATPVPFDNRPLERPVPQLMGVYDAVNGGFRRGVPKFPMPVNLELMIAMGWENESARRAVRHTLDAMAMGGIYDQVGGGFHRYSTDAKWLVPHFEKMLYDNAQLASVYARAHTLTGDPYYARVVRETLDYVRREMTAEGGAFFSAQDAEVNTREGDSYLWTGAEVERAIVDAGLSDDDAAFARSIYGLDRGPNFRDPHHRTDPPRNVLFLVGRPDALAARHGLDAADFAARRRAINAALLATRDGRDQPGTDDKILVSWNGLMIKGMVDGSTALGEPRYLDAARRAAEFILDTMLTADGGLYRTWRGRPKIDGFLEDYAFFTAGLLALHRSTGETRWLEEAERLAAAARSRFGDELLGGWYNMPRGASDLFVRTRSTRDGVVPCGASVMLHNLLDLHEATGREAYLDATDAGLRSMSSKIMRNPVSTAISTLALERFAALRPDRVTRRTTATKTERPTRTRRPTKTSPPADAKWTQTPVIIEATPGRVTVSPTTPADVEITLTIAPGYHINSNRPGMARLIPLEVQLFGGAGLKATVTYPPGERYRDEIMIHKNAVTVTVRIEQVGAYTGGARFMVVYQTCRDQACLPSDGKMLSVVISAEDP